MRTIANVVIIAFAVVLTGYILARAWVRSHKDGEVVYVTGSAQKNIVSDLVRWRGTFSRKAATPREAYAALKEDAEKVKAYLRTNGLADGTYTMNQIYTSEMYGTNNEGYSNNQIIGYELSQDVEVESTDIDRIANISRQSTELINQGVSFRSSSPQYFYTKLSDLKVVMLSAASADARERAVRIADSAKSDIGALRSARMGALQITAKNSSDFSYGGSLDTESKEKTITAVVYLSFEIK